MTSVLPTHDRADIAFTYGKGAYLYEENGKEYLDFTAGIGVNSFGHCHPELVKTLKSQADKLWHVSNTYQIKELNTFADNITKATGFDKAFFCNSGTEAVETAIKIIRSYFYGIGKPYKNRIISFKGAFHGRTLGAVSASGNNEHIKRFEPRVDGFDSVEFNDIEAVKQAISDKTAGILIEPIQGEAGIRVANQSFIKQLRALADEHDILLAFDEVQCGMGWTGYLYAYEYYGTRPDIISSAKGIGGGFPMGACLSTNRASSAITAGTHGTTFGGNPLAMSIGNRVLELMLENGFLDEVKAKGELLKSLLIDLQQQFPDIIEEVRGVGLMLAIKLNEKYNNKEIRDKLHSKFLLTVCAGENTIRLLPPLIIKEEDIYRGVESIKLGLTQTSSF